MTFKYDVSPPRLNFDYYSPKGQINLTEYWGETIDDATLVVFQQLKSVVSAELLTIFI